MGGEVFCLAMTEVTDRSLLFRQTYPDDGRYWQVLDADGEFVGVIVDHRDHANSDQPGWFWGISVFGLPQPGNFRGNEWTREDAMAKFRLWWPIYRAQYSDEEYERQRREYCKREEQWRGKR